MARAGRQARTRNETACRGSRDPGRHLDLDESGFLEAWYPKGLRRDERLPWYAQHFRLVEVNSTFYAFPKVETTRKWPEQTPRNFVFDIKLPKLLSWHSMDFKNLPPAVRQLAEVRTRTAVERTPVSSRR
jgi:uncharacterized protein YecE (DUF72 family)